MAGTAPVILSAVNQSGPKPACDRCGEDMRAYFINELLEIAKRNYPSRRELGTQMSLELGPFEGEFVAWV